MTTNPEQCWIPIDHKGRPIHNCRRHVRDCLHFFPEGDPALHVEHLAALAAHPEARVSYKREVTAEEMLVIPPCSTCGVVAEAPTLITTRTLPHSTAGLGGLCLRPVSRCVCAPAIDDVSSLRRMWTRPIATVGTWLA